MSVRFRTSVESHAHVEAKRLLLLWLRETAEDAMSSAANKQNHALFCMIAETDREGISWRVNRGAPHYGIWEEYPVLADDTGISPVWDEISDCWLSRPPTYEEVVDIGYRPMAVLDIAVQHKGEIHYAIEVVHKHRCNPQKIGFLRPRLTLIEIPAYWVLGQVGTPTAIPSEFFL